MIKLPRSRNSIRSFNRINHQKIGVEPSQLHSLTGVIYTQHGSDPETGIGEITPRKSASIRQPHWHRRLDVKRPTRGWGAPKARLRHTSTRSRLFAQVDFRREMRPIAFVDPGAFIVTNVETTRPSVAFE
jgi:hypothetical protein